MEAKSPEMVPIHDLLATEYTHHPELPESFVSPIEIFKCASRSKGYEALQQHLK